MKPKTTKHKMVVVIEPKLKDKLKNDMQEVVRPKKPRGKVIITKNRKYYPLPIN